MEDPDDNDKTAAELACVLETPEPPPFLATWVTRGSQVEAAVDGWT